MLIVSGIISMEPEGHDAAVALIGPLVEATLAEDGNHPNAAGYDAVTDIWFAALEPLL